MRTLFMAGCAALIATLSSCGPADDEKKNAPSDTSPPVENRLDGNTAPTDRDPTPQSGSGGDIPATGGAPPR
ncbi:hypothetical protein [Rhizobium sp. SGZ-381]|uniref:hypothetical protein n=1 Tax=Rhizobium sp. SGZ-381 TaxID=3342800 RepID=UPI0036701B4D